MIALKYSRNQLALLVDLMDGNDFVPETEFQLVIGSIIKDLQFAFEGKLRGKSQNFTLSLKMHEAIALKKYMQGVYNALPAASVDSTLAYNTMNEIGKKTPSFTQKQLS